MCSMTKSHVTHIMWPFLRFWTHHDDRFLYMLMEYVNGGELFSYLRSRGRFSNSTGMFYSAEIVCAIEYLHSKEIVYRDLKPENILLDSEGHIRLTDFGFAKKLSERYVAISCTKKFSKSHEHTHKSILWSPKLHLFYKKFSIFYLVFNFQHQLLKSSVSHDPLAI